MTLNLTKKTQTKTTPKKAQSKARTMKKMVKEPQTNQAALRMDQVPPLLLLLLLSHPYSNVGL